MRFDTRIIVAALTLTITLAACGELPTSTPSAPPQASLDLAAPSPSAGAQRDFEEYVYDLTDNYFAFDCDADGNLPAGDGELVRLEGRLIERTSLLRDGAGGLHMTWQMRSDGARGVGVTSGEEFRVWERSSATASKTMNRLVGRYRQELRMVGTTSHRSFVMVFSGQYLEDDNGEYIVVRDRERIVCR